MARPVYDVVVVGAGPAGSVAATLLARAGCSVLVIEKTKFSRNKACGGCLSGSALARVRRLFPLTKLPGVPGVAISFVMGECRLRLEPINRTWITLRSELDDILIREAQAEGTEVLFGTPARLLQANQRCLVQVGDEQIPSKFVLLATGLSNMGRAFGVKNCVREVPMIGQQWIIPTAATSLETGEIEMNWLREGYIGAAAIDQERSIVAMAFEPRANAASNQLEQLWNMNRTSNIWEWLSPTSPTSGEIKSIAGFPWVPNRLGFANVMLIGDAAGFAEPFTGEGINLAIRSAECAVRAILMGKKPQANYVSQMRHHRWRVYRTLVLGRLLRLLSSHRINRLTAALTRCIGTRLIRHLHVGASA